MVSIPPYHPLIIDFTGQMGVAQQQEKRAEEKKGRVQNSEDVEKVRFEKEKNHEERKKKRHDSRQEDLIPEDEISHGSKKRRIDVTV
ncbi:MAG: hypothetical protein R6V46_17340 [Desulfatiglandaceae bacterium]